MKKVLCAFLVMAIILSTAIFNVSSAEKGKFVPDNPALIGEVSSDENLTELSEITATPALAVTSGTTGDCSWTLDGTVLEISGEGSMGTYIRETSKKSDAPWGNKITKVIIGEKVTSVGAFSFFGCTALTEVSLPSTITYIRGYSFQKCTSLKNITIPNSVTLIEASAFSGSGLESVTVPCGKISSEAFGYCENLESVTLKEGVTSLGERAFIYCTALKNLKIPASAATLYSDTFRNCSALESITVTSGNANYISKNNCLLNKSNELILGCKNSTIPSTVTSLGDNAFYGCVGLTTISIPESVKSIGVYAFRDCTSLTEIVIPEKVTVISESAFMGCTSLKQIVIPEKVTSIAVSAFRNCGELLSVTLPKSVTAIGTYAFSGCDKLTTVYYDGTYLQKTLIDIKNNNTCLDYAEWIFLLCKDGHTCGTVDELKNPTESEEGYVKYHCAVCNESVTDVLHTVKKGDVNGDGKLTVSDCVCICLAESGKITLTFEQKAAADVDGIDGVSVADADYLADYIMKIKNILN